MSSHDAAIAQGLEREHSLASRLLEALQREEAALVGNDADALSQATHGKSQLIIE